MSDNLKRKAPFDLSREDIEKGNYNLNELPSKKDEEPDNSEAILQRRLYKIKGIKGQPQKQQESSASKDNIKFVIDGNLNESSKQPETKENEQVSFLTIKKQSTTEVANDEPASKAKKVEQPKETKQESEKKEQQTSLFNQPAKQQQSGQQSTGLFATSIFGANNQQSGGLFGSSNKQTGGLFGNTSQSSQQQTGGLFGNTNSSSQQQTGGLFSKPAQQTGGLFSNLNQTNLFQAPQQNSSTGLFSGGGLFANQNKDQQNTSNQQLQSSLFSSTNAGGGLFGSSSNALSGSPQFQWQQATNKNEDQNEDGNEDDNELYKDDQEEPEGEPEMKYEYKSDFESIIKKRIPKFKLGSGDSQEQGTLSIEKLTTPSEAYFIIYRGANKLIRYQGKLIEKISQYNHLNNRPDCLLIRAYTFNQVSKEDIKTQSNEQKQETENKEEEQKPEMKVEIQADFLKIMFNSTQDSTEFKTELDKIIKKEL